MGDLVGAVQGKAMTTSAIIGEKFGIAHNDLLKKIDILSGEISPVSFREMYKETTREVRGREFRVFNVIRDGYMFLVMNISTKKAHQQKLDFIRAFNEMERLLLAKAKNGDDIGWVTAREQTKQIRKGVVDVIQQFVDYAVSQGSKSAPMYFKHYTTATYSALGFIQKKNPNLRDTLDMLQLNQLVLAEMVAQAAILKYMNEEVHYKAIYKLVKNDLEVFATGLISAGNKLENKTQ